MNAIQITTKLTQNNVLILKNLPYLKGKKLKITIDEEVEQEKEVSWKDKPASAFRGALPNVNLAEWEQSIKEIKEEWGE